MNTKKDDKLIGITYNELHEIFEKYNNELLEECNKHMKLENLEVALAIQMNRMAISHFLGRIKSFVYTTCPEGE